MDLNVELDVLQANVYSMLYTMEARAHATKFYTGLGFRDDASVQILQELGISETIQKSDSNFIESIVLRTQVFDAALINFTQKNPKTIVVNLGSGLCTRDSRILQEYSAQISSWINVDLPKAMQVRESLSLHHKKVKNISCGHIENLSWINNSIVRAGRPVFIIMEGVLPYMGQNQAQGLIKALADLCKKNNLPCSMLFDYCHPLYNYNHTALNSKIKKSIEYKSGFRTVNDILNLSNNIVLAKTYKVPFSSRCNIESWNKFLAQNNHEEPYAIVELRFGNTQPAKALPMSYFGKPLYWNSKYAVHTFSGGDVAYVSDCDYHVVANKDYRVAVSFLSNASEQVNISNANLSAVYLVQQFLGLGILVAHKEQNYFLPNFNKKFQFGKNANPQLIDLTYSLSGPIKELLRELQNRTTVAIVCVDDYLDPRLMQINEHCMAKQTPWLPMSFSGNEFMLGPFFNPSKTAGASYADMQKLLWKNQPVRKMISQEKGGVIEIPKTTAPCQKSNYLKQILAIAISLVEGEGPPVLYTINKTSLVKEKHPIPILNTRNNVHEPVQQAVDLQSGIKKTEEGGGFRTVSPGETLNKLNNYISRHTGIIHPVRCIAKNKDGLPIYSSSFARYPQKNGGYTKEDFIQYSLGKGISPEHAQVSALSEAIERHNALFCGTEAYRFCAAKDLDAQAIFPAELKPYSKKQYQAFKQNPQLALAVQQFPHDELLHWLPVFSLITKQKVYVPFTHCFSNTGFHDEQYIRFNSNGCSAGNTMEEAILQGFLELIERDAVATWWYNKIKRPSVQVDLHTFPELEKIENTISDNWEHWLLDITHDFEIPIVVAVGRHKLNHEFRFGFGAHLNIKQACSRAYTELIQIIASESHTQKKFQFSKITDHAFLLPDNSKVQLFHSFKNINNADIREDINYCTEQAAKLGFDIYLCNTTRSISPLYTVKIIAPGLNFIWPEFGNKRLYTLPVTLNWQVKQKVENELNPLELFV